MTFADTAVNVHSCFLHGHGPGFLSFILLSPCVAPVLVIVRRALGPVKSEFKAVVYSFKFQWLDIRNSYPAIVCFFKSVCMCMTNGYVSMNQTRIDTLDKGSENRYIY